MTLKHDWHDGERLYAHHVNDIASTVNNLVDLVNSGEIGGGGSGAPEPGLYRVDDYGADPTGAQWSDAAVIAARQAMGDSPGMIVFGVGTYKIQSAGLNWENNMYLGPRQGVLGQGKSLTVIDYRGQGAAIELRNVSFDFTNQNWPSAGVHGVYVFGWGNNNSGIYGIRFGDIWGVTISDTHIAGFNNANSAGLYGDHKVGSSERCDIDVIIEQCTTCALFEGRPDSGTASLPDNYKPLNSSFDYSKYRITFVATKDQDVFVLRSRVADTLAGGGASMSGVQLELIGNCVAGADSNTGSLFSLGANDDDYVFLTGELHVSVEVSVSEVAPGSTPVAHADFMQTARSKVNAVGAINLIPVGGVDFRKGTSTNERFFFTGMLRRSPTLGSTGEKNQSQALQVVTQAQGRYYSNPTAAAQRVYIKAATGGTFRIGYDGAYTSALPYDASVAAVQAAVNAVPALAGNVKIWNGQARYVNGVQQNERGYGFEFQSALAGVVVPTLTVDTSSLSGTAEVLVLNAGSSNITWGLQIETGNLFNIQPSPGTYRLEINTGYLSDSKYAALYNDSPFGLAQADIWIRQPNSGGNVVLEGPYFPARSYFGSTYSFDWIDGVEPVLSTTPYAWDVIRISSVNFTSWIGQHLTKQMVVAAPAHSNSAGFVGQKAFDGTYEYSCVAPNTWERRTISLTTW